MSLFLNVCCLRGARHLGTIYYATSHDWEQNTYTDRTFRYPHLILCLEQLQNIKPLLQLIKVFELNSVFENSPTK